ncbi:MAG: MBOAT family protein [Lachnospiraceae bacterium]|nr:MBOAT family protein [Lachnospiraceae bacterium]
MALTSLEFFAFFALLLLLYHCVPQKAKNPVLIVANLVFCYLAGGVRTLAFLSFTTCCTYVGALMIERTESVKKKRAVLIVVIAANLAVLLFTKYLGFFLHIGNAVSHLAGNTQADLQFSIAAPLGVSFYTLQMIGYLADVYMEKIKAEHSPVSYIVFATFFPQITSGPISRYAELEPEISRTKKFDYKEFTFGLQRMGWGLFKKLVISERLAVLVNTIYADYETYSGFYIAAATVFFAFELYTDFSGYMDIALGAAQCLGIKLPENFTVPFFSRSISEYWRKWHITLGTWCKDYLFYPILKSDAFVKLGKWGKKKFGKKKGKNIPVRLGLIILWFTVGFWHGGSWKYIIGSGLLHCFYIIGGQILEPVSAKIVKLFKIDVECFSFRLFQCLRTFFLVCFGFLFFRAESFKTALLMIPYLFSGNMQVFTEEGMLALGLDLMDLRVLFFGLVLLLLVSVFQTQRGSVREWIAKQNLVFRWAVYLSLLFAVLLFGMYGPGFVANQFIYQNF